MGGVLNDVVKIGTLGLVDDVTGSEAAARGQQRAVDAQLQATRESNQLLERLYNQGRGDQAPFQLGGYAGLNALLALTGLPQVSNADVQGFTGQSGWYGTQASPATPGTPAAPTAPPMTRAPGGTWSDLATRLAPPTAPGAPATPGTPAAPGAPAQPGYTLPTFGNAQQLLQNDPGYQFRLNQGQQGLDRRLAAMGMSGSGRALKDTIDYNQGMASQEYGNVWNRLANIAGVGQSATGAQQQNAQQYGQAAGENILQGGNARASGYIAAGNQDRQVFNDLLKLGGAGLKAYGAGAFSDRRLKSNIQPLGERNGYQWYSYDIFGQPSVGVMADEVQKIKPEAVSTHPSGYLMVDYGAL